MLKEFNLDDYKYQITDMPWSEFSNSFKPLKNSHISDAQLDGYLLEHDNGAQWDQVRSTHVQLVWTLIEEDGNFFLRNGLLVKNRRGYVIAERNHNPRELIKVPVDL